MNITFLRIIILLVHEISEPTNLHKENPPAGLLKTWFVVLGNLVVL